MAEKWFEGKLKNKRPVKRKPLDELAGPVKIIPAYKVKKERKK